MAARALLRDVAAALHITVPTALSNAMEYLPALVAVIVVGRGRDGTESVATDLDAFALARVYVNTVAVAPGFGYITALRTLCPQAVGAGKPELCALYLQRAFAVVIIGFLPSVPLLLLSDKVLIALGQPAHIAALTRPLCLRMAPQYFGYVCMSALQRVYQAEGLNWANFVITALVAAIAVPLTWILVHPLGLGVLGAAWAGSACTSLYLVLQVPHLVCTGHGYLFRPLPPSKVFARAGMCEYVRLAAPGFVMQVLEWWVQELVVLVAGLLRHAQVTIGAFTLTMAFHDIGVMAWIGLAVASSTLVGTRIGAGQAGSAKRAALVVSCIGLSLAGCYGGLLALWPSALASLCTDVDSIRAFTASLLPAVGAVVLADASSNALGGCCSGLGLQRYAAVAQLGGYALGMSTGAALAFGWRHGEEDGAFMLWAGLGISMAVAALIQLGLLCVSAHRPCNEMHQPAVASWLIHSPLPPLRIFSRCSPPPASAMTGNEALRRRPRACSEIRPRLDQPTKVHVKGAWSASSMNRRRILPRFPQCSREKRVVAFVPCPLRTFRTVHCHSKANFGLGNRNNLFQILPLFFVRYGFTSLLVVSCMFVYVCRWAQGSSAHSRAYRAHSTVLDINP